MTIGQKRERAGDEIGKFWSPSDFQSAGEGEAIQAPKMVTARSSRSVSQPRLDLNHLNSPFLCLFHQSVAGSNYLAASVAWWSLVFHFFSCSDRHHCSTQGLFCFHWNRSVLLPLLSLTSMGLQARLFARFQRSTTKNETNQNVQITAYLYNVSNEVYNAEFFSPKNLKNMIAWIFHSGSESQLNATSTGFFCSLPNPWSANHSPIVHLSRFVQVLVKIMHF